MKRNRVSGMSLMEVMAGSLVLIPVVLLAVDGAYAMIASKNNQELAESAARIAANKLSQTDALTAATNTIAAFQKTDNMRSVKIDRLDYNKQDRVVTVIVAMDITMPVPLPGLSETHLTAQSVHPIVAIPAER